MKKFISVAAVAALGILTAVSCNNDNNPGVVETDSVAQKVLKNFIFTEENKSLTENFTLPAVQVYKDVEYRLAWTSDSSYIQIATEAGDKGYAATVTRPTDKRVDVKLTVTLYASETDYATAEFIVHVGPYTVYEVCDAFNFKQNKATVYSDFELPTTTHYADGVDATISWEVVGRTSPLAIEGNTVKVTPQENRVNAQLKATFTFNGEITSKVYEVTVFHERTPEELFHAFYEEATVYDEAFTVYGYVTAKAGYSDSYGDGYLFVMDQTKLGGYYIYCAYCTQAVWDSLEVGTRVKIPACVATIYKGLYETTNSKDKKLEVITDDSVLAPLSADELATLKAGKAIDNQVVTGQKDLVYQTGNIVSLTSWKVTDVKASPKATEAATLLTLEKNGVSITVSTNKYAIDLATDATNPTVADKVVASLKDIKVNDFVNVTGILYYSGGYTVVPVTEGAIAKTTDDAGASTAAAAALLKAVSDTGLTTAAVIRNKTVDINTVTLPAGVTLTASLSEGASSVTLADGVITFTPVAEGETVTITLVATDGTYKFEKEFEILVKAMTDAEMVAAEKEAIDLSDISEFGEYELDLVGPTYSDVAIAWELTEANGIATLAADGKTLTIKSVDETTTVKLTATLTCGDVEDTKEVTITIENKARLEYQEIADPATDTQYYVGLYQGKLKKQLFATGEVNDKGYLTTVEDYTTAGLASVEKNGTKYAFKFANGKYIALDGTKLVLSDTKFEWEYNATYGAWYASAMAKKTVTAATFDSLKDTLYLANDNGYTKLDASATFADGTDYYAYQDYYFGTYSSYDTLSASNISYAATSYVGHLYKVNSLVKTKQQKAQYEADKAVFALDQASTDKYKLPTTVSLFEDVTVTYAVDSADATGTTIVDGEIIFGEVASAATVKVIATYTCEDKSVEKEITFNVSPLVFSDVSTVVTSAQAGDKVAIQGIVDEKGSNYIWITDGVNRFEFWNAPVDGSVVSDYSSIALGQRVYALGTLYIHNGTVYEFSGTTKVMKVESNTATDLEKVLITVNEIADALDDFQDNTEEDLATAGSIFTDAPITWSLKETYTTAKIEDGKLKITQSDSADESCVLVASVTVGEVTRTKEIPFTVKKASATKTVTLAYSSSTSTTLTESTIGNDFAADLGLNDTIFNVYFTKQSASYPALYQNSIRLYGNSEGGNIMTITCATGYRIDSVVITYDTSKTGATGTVNSDTIAAISTTHTSDTFEYAAADAVTSVVITNTSTSQLRIKSIEITYTKTA